MVAETVLVLALVAVVVALLTFVGHLLSAMLH
jgi:hypothetical protein